MINDNSNKNINVFVGYRENYGDDVATKVNDYFSSKGFCVLQSSSSTKLEDFNEKIIKYINSCEYYFLILTPNCLDECVNEKDLLRLEIECALKNETTKIIPFYLFKFQFPDNLPKSIEKIKIFGGIECDILNIDYTIKMLYGFIRDDIMKNNQYYEKDELIDLLDKLYYVIMDFKTAFENSDEDKIKFFGEYLTYRVQKIFEFYEKYNDSEPRLSQYAFDICVQFNEFVPYYNYLAHSLNEKDPNIQTISANVGKVFQMFIAKVLKTIDVLNNN